MEVFMHNLPRDLTDRGLTLQLEPILKSLGIVDFICEKPGKMGYGHITFLHRSDGTKFLASYGEEQFPDQPSLVIFKPLPHKRQPRARARLSILGNGVYCKLSNRAADPITIRGLSHAAEGRVAPAEPPKDESTVFELQGLSCGYNMFVGGVMTFFSERTLIEPGMAKFFKRRLVIELRRSHVQIRIPFSTIVEIVQGTDSSLLITLSLPPVFLASNGLQSLIEEQMATLLGRLNFEGGLFDTTRSQEQHRISAIDAQHKDTAPYCLVYRLQIAPAQFREKMKRIVSKEFLTITRHNVPAQLGVSPNTYIANVMALKEQLARLNARATLPFGILYSLQALVYNGYLHPVTVGKLAERLVQMRKPGTEGFPISADAMKKLFEWIDYPTPFGDALAYEVEYLVDMLNDAEKEIQEGSAVRSVLFGENGNSTRTYRAVVTPTRITLHGPELTAKNRILRKFPKHQDYFIRVQFGDEGGEDLFFNSRVSLEDIYTRFKEVLNCGIEIAGRRYSFLGFSHSSLRAHSAWFCAPFMDNDQLHTHFTIIDNLGDFSEIKSPARRAARIGQAFSETPFSISLVENNITVSEKEDVTSADKRRVFSDGVGTLSEAAMVAIWSHLPQKKAEPTCFQIRYAGAKGMLCYDPRLDKRQVYIRPSMIKFSSRDTANLEICDMAAKPIPLVLNRQLIKILEDMGAPESWFVKLQNRELNRLRGITANAYNTATFLKYQSIGEAIRLPRLLRRLEAMGIDYRKDRFLRTVVEAVVLKEVRLLKHKARIPVGEGATLFGVMDETGYLQENEVYISCDVGPGEYAELEARHLVLVTRSPALHPGDVQVAWSISPPPGHPLTELRNCIVFSQRGSRDLPSQLSGGDLDGDIYNIIWDPALAISGITTFMPADYPRTVPLTLDRPVTKDDMANFFVDFMKTDHLGVIATRHMILADQTEAGTLDEKCVQLAQLHSTAVDFSKTGMPVELKQLPRSGRFRPDFLAPGPQTHIYERAEVNLEEESNAQGNNPDDEDGPRHKYYRSEKLLGRLYRAVDETKIWYEDIRGHFPRGGASFWGEFLSIIEEECAELGAPIDWARRIGDAERICHAYDDAILSAMTDFSDHPVEPLTELEIFVGFIINKSGVQTSRQRDRSHKLRDEFERVSGWIVAEMRKTNTIDNDAGKDPLSSASASAPMSTDALELCLACVHVATAPDMHKRRAVSARYTTSARGGNAGGLESFRIVAAAALVQELRACQRAAAEKEHFAGNVAGRGMKV